MKTNEAPRKHRTSEFGAFRRTNGLSSIYPVICLVALIAALPAGAAFTAISGTAVYNYSGLIAVLPNSSSQAGGSNPYLETGPGLEDRAYRLSAQLETDASRGLFSELAAPGAKLSLENQRGSGRYEASSVFLKIQAQSESQSRSSNLVSEVIDRAIELSISDNSDTLITTRDRITILTVVTPQSDDEGASQAVSSIGVASLTAAVLAGFAVRGRRARNRYGTGSNSYVQELPEGSTHRWVFAYVALLVGIPAGLSLPGLPISISPASAVTFIAVAALGLTWIAAYDTRSHQDASITTAVVIFAASLAFSIVYALASGLPIDEAHASYRTAVSFVPYVVLYTLVCQATCSYENYVRVRRSVSVAAAGLAVIAALQASGIVDYTAFIRSSGLFRTSVEIATTLERTGSLRVTGTTSHPIELGLVCAATFFLPLLGLGPTPSRRRIASCSTLSIVILVGAALSVSRTAFIGIAIAVTLLIVLWSGPKRKILVGIVLAGAFLATVMFYDTVLRIITLFIRSSSDTSIAGRVRDYNSAYSELAENPLLGRGFGTRIYGKYNVLDNQYLLTVLEAGIVGLLALLLLLVVTTWVLTRIRRLSLCRSLREESSALLAGLAVITFGMATFDYFSFSSATALVFIYFALAQSLRRIDMNDKGKAPESTHGQDPGTESKRNRAIYRSTARNLRETD